MRDRCSHGRCLVASARHGERRALEGVLERLYLPVRSQAGWLCRDPEAAEDLTQTALMHVVERIGQLRENTRLLGWTRRIVINLHRMAGRQSKFAPRELTEYSDSMHFSAEAGPFEQMARRELERVLAPLMARLPERLGEVARLRLLEGRTTTQTASRLHITEEAVRTRLLRARRMLREALDGHQARTVTLSRSRGPAAR